MTLFALVLACSTPGPVEPPAPPPEPAMVVSGADVLSHVKAKTFTSDSMTLVFDADGKVLLSWPHMKGDAVAGKIGVGDDSIDILWDTEAANTLNRVFRMKQTSTCSITLVHREQRVRGNEDVEIVFEQTEPACTD